MTESQTFARIMLSVPDSPGKLRDTIAMADCLNHAISSDHGLQISLGGLVARGLVREDRRRFCTTDSGSQLLARLRPPGQTMMKTWNLVGAEPAASEDITLAETTSAYNAYGKAFRKAYSESERSGRDAKSQ